MKDTIRTSRTAGYLEKIFRAINADWFGGELEEPIITIQSTPRAYGHVTVSKIWKSKGEERRHELNIGSSAMVLATVPTQPIAAVNTVPMEVSRELTVTAATSVVRQRSFH